MAELILPKKFKSSIAKLDASITDLNHEKIILIFKALDIYPGDELFAIMLEWKLIVITVMDRQMGIQMNALCSYVPNLKFVVDIDRPLFSVLEGVKGRRVWKER